VIVTVVATGFDASYFTQTQKLSGLGRRGQGLEAPVSASASGISRDEEAAMSNMDVSLEESNKTDDFQSNSPIENIMDD